jgi:hypothetical protein
MGLYGSQILYGCRFGRFGNAFGQLAIGGFNKLSMLE